jgi:hypothetical protein
MPAFLPSGYLSLQAAFHPPKAQGGRGRGLVARVEHHWPRVSSVVLGACHSAGVRGTARQRGGLPLKIFRALFLHQTCS